MVLSFPRCRFFWNHLSKNHLSSSLRNRKDWTCSFLDVIDLLTIACYTLTEETSSSLRMAPALNHMKESLSWASPPPSSTSCSNSLGDQWLTQLLPHFRSYYFLLEWLTAYISLACFLQHGHQQWTTKLLKVTRSHISSLLLQSLVWLVFLLASMWLVILLLPEAILVDCRVRFIPDKRKVLGDKLSYKVQWIGLEYSFLPGVCENIFHFWAFLMVDVSSTSFIKKPYIYVSPFHRTTDQKSTE